MSSSNRYLRMSKGAAAYVVRHVNNACRSIVAATRQGAPLEQISPSLTPRLGELHERILTPIFRLHPGLMAEPDDGTQPKKVYRATKKDISRSTAIWLMRELLRAHLALVKASSDFIAQKSDQRSGGQAEAAVLNADTEVVSATSVISEAYPDVWYKQLTAAMPRQVRTAELDANFRNAVAPRGSVKLTAQASAKIRSFMREARRTTPNEDFIVSLGWAIDGKSKGPEDKTWTSILDGLLLGTWLRSQLPPDVIDKVDGIEIVFTADRPDRLIGKTIDFQKGAFVIRD
ncbi:MAG: hypothetical protein ACREB8_06855 [Pseudolabrys sp.]